MDSSLLVRLAILVLLFVVAVLFFLRPRFGGGKGGAKGNRVHSAHVYGGNTPPDEFGPSGNGSTGGGD